MQSPPDFSFFKGKECCEEEATKWKNAPANRVSFGRRLIDRLVALESVIWHLPVERKPAYRMNAGKGGENSINGKSIFPARLSSDVPFCRILNIDFHFIRPVFKKKAGNLEQNGFGLSSRCVINPVLPVLLKEIHIKFNKISAWWNFIIHWLN
jgi:hypothetical protein